MTDVVRMGVVGAGTIALRGILPHLSQEDVRDRVRLRAVCDPVPGRAEAAAARFGIPSAYGTLDELLDKAGVDAVSIASPIGLHHLHGKLALEAGKHVHFNKTMTTTAAEATELIELAASKGLKIVASPGEVLRPQNQQIKRLIEDGALGTLSWAICGSSFGTYHEDEPEREGQGGIGQIDPSWYFRKPGGGPLYDMTVYNLHALTTVLGPAGRVTALSGVRIDERPYQGRVLPTDADDNTLMLLDFGESLFAMVYGTAAGHVPTSYFGTTGAITGLELNGAPIQYTGWQIAAQAPGWDGQQWVLPHVVGPHRHIDEQHVYEDIMQLVDWVRGDGPSMVTAEHARHVIEIIECAYRSAETGKIQELATAF